ncbi:S8 family serine peptidase [Halovenus rubra]|uniref:S8 family serine peptidase n=2 Tax=Halovenus rubra TaxID=869890 RepID=A0ACC7E1B6_9EURY|nr:S8 family serine peptidase [Halovenus rubra]
MSRLSGLVGCLSLVLVFSLIWPWVGFTGGAVGAGQTPFDEKERNQTANFENQTVVVRFEPVDRDRLSGSDRPTVTERLKDHANKTQKPFLRWAKRTDSVAVKSSYWLTNAVLVSVSDKLSRAELVDHPHVVGLHNNFEVSVPDTGEPSSQTASATGDVTEGLDLLGVPEVWETYGVRGDGADVAIIDTGVDITHPDLTLPSSRWAHFDKEGNLVDSQPHDNNGHGTHVSGTVVGPTNPAGDVPAYGVAPEATLWHVKALDSSGVGTFEQLVAAMEWVVTESDVDIVGMSLGAEGYHTQLIEPAQHLRDAGIILTTSVGNSGPETTSSPGNYQSAFTTGAVDSVGNVADFSSGNRVDTANFTDEVPDSWETSYIKPDVVAPGIDITSTSTGTGYETLSGTSMAQPHTAGIFALLVSALGTTDRERFQHIIKKTADDREAIPKNREGSGIIDATAAIGAILGDDGVSGTVQNTGGQPLGKAQITVEETGATVRTESDGTYSVPLAPGQYTITATAFGYESQTKPVTVSDNNQITTQFSLNSAPDLNIVDGLPKRLGSGISAASELTVANATKLTIDNRGTINGSLTVTVDGDEVSFGTPIPLSPGVNDVNIGIQVGDKAKGTLGLSYTVESGGMVNAVDGRRVTVLNEQYSVGVVEDNSSNWGQTWANKLEGRLPAKYSVDSVSAQNVIETPHRYDSYFVHSIDDTIVDEWMEATSDIGVVYTSQHAGPDALNQRSTAIGDPDTVRATPGLRTWRVVEEHPLFDGVATRGDTITVHKEDVFADGASFSGTEGTIIAEAANGKGAVAIDSSRNDIMLTSVGFGWVLPGEHTRDALSVVTNAVTYFLDSEPTSKYSLGIADGSVSNRVPNTTVRLSARGDEIAGYQSFIEFDPDRLQIDTVSPMTFETVYELNNQEGWLNIAGTAPEGRTDPILAELSVTVNTTATDNVTLFLGGESKLNGKMGSKIDAVRNRGQITIRERQLGDVLNNGRIHSGDAIIVQRYLAGLDIPVSTETVETYGDIDQDGDVTSADVSLLLQYLVTPRDSNLRPGNDKQQGNLMTALRVV